MLGFIFSFSLGFVFLITSIQVAAEGIAYQDDWPYTIHLLSHIYVHDMYLSSLFPALHVNQMNNTITLLTFFIEINKFCFTID